MVLVGPLLCPAGVRCTEESVDDTYMFWLPGKKRYINSWCVSLQMIPHRWERASNETEMNDDVTPLWLQKKHFTQNNKCLNYVYRMFRGNQTTADCGVQYGYSMMNLRDEVLDGNAVDPVGRRDEWMILLRSVSNERRRSVHMTWPDGAATHVICRLINYSTVATHVHAESCFNSTYDTYTIVLHYVRYLIQVEKVLYLGEQRRTG